MRIFVIGGHAIVPKPVMAGNGEGPGIDGYAVGGPASADLDPQTPITPCCITGKYKAFCYYSVHISRPNADFR